MAAIVRERVRLARDLHDGVLQDLTAARLMIKPLADSSTAKVKTDLQEISGILAQQQQRIRSFVRTVNPKPAADWDFAAEFRALAATLQRQWQCEVVADPACEMRGLSPEPSRTCRSGARCRSGSA